MINFSKLLKDLQDKEGRCLLPDTAYDWVDGYRKSCITGQCTYAKVHYIIEPGYSGMCFTILNGVTGFESYYVDDLLDNDYPEDGFDAQYFPACCGTMGRWDGLYLNWQQVKGKLQQFKRNNAVSFEFKEEAK